VLLATAALAVAQRLEDTELLPLDHKAILYWGTPAGDAVSRLQERIDRGEAKLDYQPGNLGYLPSVLKLLGIDPDSQVLVFSRNSAQSPRISPQSPRAIYFNDDVAVGFVQGGEVLEFAALDPKEGVRLYTLDSGRTLKPVLGNHPDCLQCHQGPQTLAVPGLMVTSLYPPPPGMPVEHASSGFVTDQRTAIADRWGGWYVTGTAGKQDHLGNTVPDPATGGVIANRLNRTSLAGLLDTSRYLAPTSDIVALLTLEHQTRMTNLITRVGWDTRIAISDGTLEQSRPQLDADIEDMLTYMLFTNEAFSSQPVKGVSTFSKTFPQRGPRDKQGRSLRDFDLQTRLFKYPLSYMIYDPAFDAMPDWAKDRIYRRLYDVLTGKDMDPKFARLSAQDRRAILEILRDTKTGLPDYWKP
jgi:hypothetical protein